MFNISGTFRRFKDLSLSTQMLILYSSFIVVASIFFYIYIPNKLFEAQKIIIYHNSNNLVQMLAFTIAPELYFGDERAISESIIWIDYNPDINFLVVENNEGKVVFSKNLEMAEKNNYKTATLGDILSKTNELFLIASGVHFKKESVGVVYMGIDISWISHEIIQLRRMILILTFCLIICGFLYILFIGRLLTKPLTQLVRSFQNIDLSNLSIRIPVESQNELGRLAYSFNQMIERLENAYKEIENLNQSLLCKVEELLTTKNELLKIKDELTVSLAKEQELNELKNRFISMVSHEYRTPLSAILTTTYIVSKFAHKGDIQNVEKHLKKIEEYIKTMVDLLENVLLYSKQHSGKIKLNLEEVDIIELVSSVVDEYKFLDKKSHYLIFNNFVTNTAVTIDTFLLKQAIGNLISNALKYTENGKRIFVELSDSEDTISIIVGDEGRGIPQNEIKFLFDPFFRSSNSINVKGTGLGLSIVKNIVEMFGGQIFVESELGKGTTFRLLLPRKSKYPFK